MKINKMSLLIAALTGVTLGTSSATISLSSVNSFDTDQEGWFEGAQSPNPPTHSSGNGPDGNPGHLINMSDAGGSGGRFLMWNTTATWTGDYAAAGVMGISLQVDNRSGSLTNGATTVPLRVALNGPGGWFISNAISISDNTVGVDEWQLASFGLDAASLTHITGTGTNNLAATLVNVTAFEILVSASGTPSVGGGGTLLRGDSLISDLRFDDIQAISIPEPSSALLAALGLLPIYTRRKR